MSEEFLWGVATAAYQVEGGLNGAGDPANNWATWDRSGRVEPVGQALRFWEEPEALLDRAQAMGCNTFRLSVEWARLQPSPDARLTIEPEWDPAALDRYADILAACRERGMEPIVTLHHFTHPLWSGTDLWLRPDAPDRFARYVRTCTDELGRRLVDRGGSPVRWWITINEPAIVAVLTYLLGMFPGTGRGIGKVITSYDHLVAGHICAYDGVHDVYEARGWDPPLVSVNPFSMTTVDLDALLVDLLLAREKGIARRDLGSHLDRARTRARRRVAAVPRRNAFTAAVDRAMHVAAKATSRHATGAAADALYRSPRDRKLDYLSLDYYDAVMGHQVGPAPRGARSLRPMPGFAPHWEQETSPDGLAVFLRQAHVQAPDRPILIAENGMATPGMRPRPDGLGRDAYLRMMCREVLRARDEGIPVCGYVHWTIADNYEWGSYEPRFGLHGVDRSNGVRILDTDATGVDAPGVYREIVEG